MTSPRNARAALAIIGIAASAALLSACSVSEPIETHAPETNSPDPQTGTGGILPNGISTFGPSPYLSSTISDDDPAMQFDADDVSDVAAGAYSEDEVAEAQAFIVRFIAEHHLDTPLLNASGEDGVEWFEARKDALDPEQWDDFREPLSQPGVGGVIPDYQWLEGETVLDVEYSQETPRVIDRKIELDEIDLSASGDALLFEFDLEGRIAGTEVGGESRELFLFIEGDASFALLPSESGWMIVDFTNDMHAQTQSK